LETDLYYSEDYIHFFDFDTAEQQFLLLTEKKKLRLLNDRFHLTKTIVLKED